MTKRKNIEERLHRYERAYRELTLQLAGIGYMWNGSIVRQRLKCGKKSCACHKDVNRRHGPYPYWSTKVRGKTVSRLLKAEEADLYGEWIENRRRLNEIRRKMLNLSKKSAPLILKLRESGRAEEEKRKPGRSGGRY